MNDTIPHDLLRHGSIEGKRPVVLTDRKTVIYIRPDQDEEAVRLKYENHLKGIIIPPPSEDVPAPPVVEEPDDLDT